MTAEEFQKKIAETNAKEPEKRHVGSPEHDLQVQCLEWFRLRFRSFYDLGLIWATPNGGKRNLRAAARLRAEGMRAGVPDLFIAIPRKGYHGFFIEMKNGKKGVVRESQKTLMGNLSGQGYKCEVCRTFEDFTDMVNKYMYV